jgi:hypothetical protein|tara:strand:+ start:909 stop:1256 length:348 start_codon:yes stop_codon:yes gene_type:complete
MTDIGFVIATYYSGQGFYIDNNDYETLRWYETNTLPKPTLEELTEKWDEHLAAQPLKELREERNRRLAEVDWVVIRAFSMNTPVTDDWKTYMQALRDLPSTTEDPVNPVWPTPPQ